MPIPLALLTDAGPITVPAPRSEFGGKAFSRERILEVRDRPTFPATSLPIMVSDRNTLSDRGLLSKSWPPRGDADCLPLALVEPGARERDGLRRWMRRRETRYSC